MRNEFIGRTLTLNFPPRYGIPPQVGRPILAAAAFRRLPGPRAGWKAGCGQDWPPHNRALTIRVAGQTSGVLVVLIAYIFHYVETCFEGRQPMLHPWLRISTRVEDGYFDIQVA